MTELILGKVRPVYKGDWDEVSTYEYYDMVRYEKQLYLAVADSIPANHIPSDQPDSWVLFGARGEKGEAGEKGDDGQPGPAGEQGPQGATGVRGKQGVAGPKGDPGITWKPSVDDQGVLTWTASTETPTQANIKGPKGDTGKTGSSGADGKTWRPNVDKSGNLTWEISSDQSAPEAQNIKGPKGDTGAKGAAFVYSDFTEEQLEALKGPKGDQGPTGPQGAPGLNGKDGKDGVSPELEYATQTQAGILQLATTDEVIKGVLSNKAISPQTLSQANLYVKKADTDKLYIKLTGNTGVVKSYQNNSNSFSGTSYTLNKDSPEYLSLPTAITNLTIGASSFEKVSYTKVIHITKSLTVKLSSGWSWAQGEAPELAAGFIVATACGSIGIATFVGISS